MTGHPLTGPLTRAAEASGALRALLLADAPDVDRDALTRLLGRFAAELAAVPWAHPGVRANAGRLARLLADDEGRRNVVDG